MGDPILGRSATPVRHKWHLRLSLNGPRGDGGDGFERHGTEEGRERRMSTQPALLPWLPLNVVHAHTWVEEGIEGRMDIAAGRSLLRSSEKEFLL